MKITVILKLGQYQSDFLLKTPKIKFSYSTPPVMKFNHRQRGFLLHIKRNKFTFLLILIFVIFVIYRRSTGSFKRIFNGENLKNIQSEKENLEKNQNLNIFFIDADPGDEKVLEDARQACSVESAGS